MSPVEIFNWWIGLGISVFLTACIAYWGERDHPSDIEDVWDEMIPKLDPYKAAADGIVWAFILVFLWPIALVGVLLLLKEKWNGRRH